MKTFLYIKDMKPRKHGDTARKISFILSVVLLLFCMLAMGICAQQTQTHDARDSLLAVAQGIVAWKRADCSLGEGEGLLCDPYLRQAGSTPGDWYPIGIGRFGFADDYDAYLAVIRENVTRRYATAQRLDRNKATEWHRIALAVLAMGADPTAFGSDEAGNPIDLIADGTYNRGKTAPLGKQGINGWIWGLIALDSRSYEVPQGASDTRESILTRILARQLPDGGFALTGQQADPDMSAMALQALAPYRNDETLYTYTRRADGIVRTVRVRTVIEEALAALCALQTEDGGFVSWGTKNSESVSQVIIALCSLGIDPFTETRFIRNGNTLPDVLLSYRMSNGGFLHSHTYDADNPGASPEQSNSMAGEQALLALCALWRLQNGMRALYDFTAPPTDAMRVRVRSLMSKIDKTGDETEQQVLHALATEYYALPHTERRYVKNYTHLSELCEQKSVDIRTISETTEVIQSSAETEEDHPLLWFSESDCAALAALPDALTTEWEAEVLRLLYKAENAQPFDGQSSVLDRLRSAKQTILAIRSQIDALNREIEEKLYPFESLTLADRKTVYAIAARYEALSPYDRTQVTHYEDVLRSRTQLDNLLRAWIIGAVLAVCAAAAGTLLAVRLHRRRTRARREMEELAACYRDENDADAG